MKNVVITIGFLLVAGFLILAGCSQPATPPVTPTQATPVPTQIPATTVITPETTVAPIGMGTPGPTEALPPQYNVLFQVTPNGNTANPIMYVALSGGNGMNFIAGVDVVLTMPNGTVNTATMSRPFTMGQNVAIPCSQDKNRIEIWVTAPTVGKIKTYDKIVPFQSINP